MDVHTKLQSLRKNKGVSVYRLSRMTDVSENHIHRIERGEAQPSVLVLEKLLTAMGTSLPEFFNSDSEIVYLSETKKEIVSLICGFNETQSRTLLEFLKTVK